MEQMFNPGDSVKFKPEEELSIIIRDYFGEAFPDYSKFILAHAEQVFEIKDITVSYAHFKNNEVTYDVHFKEKDGKTHYDYFGNYRIIQDYLINVADDIKVDDTIPVLFGDAIYRGTIWAVNLNLEIV